MLFLLVSNGMIQPEKRLYIKMNISEVMRTQQGNCKQFIWTSKIVHFLPFTTAKSKVGCWMLLHSLCVRLLLVRTLRLLKWWGPRIKFRVGRGVLRLSLSASLLIPPLSIYIRRSAVVKVLCYKSEDSWFDSWWWHWNNPSDRTMTLGSIQPLREMSTRSIFSGVKAAVA